jgi:serum/glucocorticoid-regulated kinase 2
MYQKILHNPLVFSDVIGSDARSILTGLLSRDPSKRLGVNGAEEIKKHPFFHKHIDFKLLWQKKIQPPFKPKVASAVDVSNFDTVFTSEEPLDSVVEDTKLSQTVQEQFAGTCIFTSCFVLAFTHLHPQASRMTAQTCRTALRRITAAISIFLAIHVSLSITTYLTD